MMHTLDRVLVVDFDERQLVDTTALLEHHGFAVTPAGTIAEVLAALEPGAPRAIVMEPALHGRDGFELCRSILDSCVGAQPVVMLASSVLDGHDPHFRAKEVGAHMFVERPADNDMLIQALSTVMSAAGIRVDRDAPAYRVPDEAPVLDEQFEDWVERTFQVDGETESDESSDFNFDAIAAQPHRSDERRLEGGEAIAVANRAALLVSDAMRPPQQPRRVGGLVLMLLAVMITLAGVVLWLLIGTDRGADPFEMPAPRLDATTPVSPASLDRGGPIVPVVNAETPSSDATQPEPIGDEPPTAVTEPAASIAREPVIVAPVLIRSSRVTPRYPPQAERLGQGGRVVIGAVVTSEGSLADLEVLYEPPGDLGFGTAALAAVEQWSYWPAARDGVLIDKPIKIEVQFRP